MEANRLEKLLPVAGAIILFVAWAVQQVLSVEWNASLSRIGSSEAVFHTYRANNAVFRALRAAAPAHAKGEIETQQIQNYDRGLAVLRASIDPILYEARRKRAMETTEDGVKFENFSTDAKILVEFETMQWALADERNALSKKKSIAERIFYGLYVLGTLLAIAGGIAKLLSASREKTPK